MKRDKMRRVKIHHENGFTLIELLITLAVLSFGLLSLAGLQVQLVRANAFNGEMTIATAIGTDYLEQSKAQGYHGLPPKEKNVPQVYTIPDVNGNPYDPYNGRFTMTRTITMDPKNHYKIVEITVSWVDVKNHMLRFKTTIAE